jgi:hypothetical protein
MNFWRTDPGASRRGHHVTFFERDTPFYAQHRDIKELDGGELVLYEAWKDVRREVARRLATADAAIVTSYCPDAVEASEAVLGSPARVRCFYDLDTGVTLKRVREGQKVEYVPENGLADFDLVLSYTGGLALGQLKSLLGARHVAPLYGSVDRKCRPVALVERFWADFSYSARMRRTGSRRWRISSSSRRGDGPICDSCSAVRSTPGEFPWTENLFFIPHVPPQEHAAFYCSSRLTLSVTSSADGADGLLPVGAPVRSRRAAFRSLATSGRPGLLFRAGAEIVVARTTACDGRSGDDGRAARQDRAGGRERVLAAHTADRRALDLENILEAAVSLPVEEAGAARE